MLLSQKTATVALFGDSRRIRRQIVAEIGIYSRQCGQAHCHRKRRLPSKSATVAENGDCRTFLRLSPFSATVALFGDSRRFRRQIVAEIGNYNRQCGQALTRERNLHSA